jgi:preprotein translocase subunit SecE
VARNRKRAKERRSRRPVPTPGAAPRVATARVNREGRDAERHGGEETPGPLEHATPDAELAEAQLAVGRPEYAVEGDDQLAADAELADELAGGSGDSDDGGSEGRGSGLTPTGGAAPAPRVSPVGRLVNFLQGSWRELQRVQWPNRQQVMQATGVVIGFVIVAGIFLGLADTVASKLVTLILK